METLKKAGIRKLQVRAKRRHNLSKKQFYKLTPYEFQLYEEDYKDEIELVERRMGRLMALLANINKGKSTKKYTEDDFILECFVKKDEASQLEKSFRALASKFKFRKVEDGD
jgi:HAMP domain-containing protein